jgi:hypothetical protein
MKRKSRSIDPSWARLISHAEDRLRRSERKTGQISAILTAFREQAASGQPCPTSQTGLDSLLSKPLH